MRLIGIEIHNYKSLRDVIIAPSPLSVLVGPNAAGKTNFCDALDFLGEAYRLGLELAVARKGGYENICFRRQRRSKAPIHFRLRFELDTREWGWPLWHGWRRRKHQPTILFDHMFEIRTESQNIGSPFYVSQEELGIWLEPSRTGQRQLSLFDYPDEEKRILHYKRDGSSNVSLDISSLEQMLVGELEKRFFETLTSRFDREGLEKRFPETEFFLSFVDQLLFGIAPFRTTIGSLRVFQLSPRNCRESGVPTPNPELDRFGGNLPAVVEHLKTQYQDRYLELLDTVRRVMPTLEGIETQYTHRKTLGLFVSEEGFGRPWAATDISDGTIQTIALLVAVFDPRTSIVVVEEPENSIHPWALRNFVKAARGVADTKQVILTTHSPILIDQLRPEELWIVQRAEGETKLRLALELDPTIKDAWGKGRFTLSEYLDSGALPEAVPAD